jgi:hypothetical protein
VRSLHRLAILVLTATSAGACGQTPSARAAPAPAVVPAVSTLAVPRVAGPVKIDAELEGKKMWEADTGVTPNFTDAAGHGMVPFTQAKARWGEDQLYLMLYAGDLDLEGTVREHDGPVERDDAFHLEFGAGDEVRVISVSVLGTVADSLCRRSATGRTCDRGWDSHARVAVDSDGTLNKIGDNDEEWVIEMAIPLASLGVTDARPGAKIPFSVRRCEVGHGQNHGCGGWGDRPRGELALAP